MHLMRHALSVVVAVATLSIPAAPAFSQDSGDLSVDDILKDARERERGRLRDIEQAVWAKTVVARFEARVQETDELLQELDTRHAKLVARIDELLTSEDGKRIGRDDAAAVHFVALREQPVVRKSDMQAQQAFVSSMSDFIRRQKQRPEVGYTPEEQHIAQTDDAFLWVRDRLAKTAEINAWLDDAIARTGPDVDVSGDVPLGEQVNAYLAARRQLWLEARLRGEQAAREEAAPRIEENARIAELELALAEAEWRLKEAREKNERDRITHIARLRSQQAENTERLAAIEEEYAERIAIVERERRLAEAERGLRDVTAEREAREVDDAALRIELVQKCSDPEVLRDLKPFLDKGYWQPGDRERNLRFEESPMSWNAIVGYGATENNEQGWQQLLAIANRTGCKGARGARTYTSSGPRGHFDTERAKWNYDNLWRKLSPDQKKEVIRIQALLIELGPTLVEEGLLAQ